MCPPGPFHLFFALLFLPLLDPSARSAVAQAPSSGLVIQTRPDSLLPEDSLEIHIRNGTGNRLRAGLCGSRVQRLSPLGAWVDADTLECNVELAPLNTQGGEMILRLRPGFADEYAERFGAGTYRIVVMVAGSDGAPIPPESRASDRFLLLDFAALHPGVIGRYSQMKGWNALAVAFYARGKYVWGHSHGYGTAAAAVNRALDECRERTARRPSAGPCRILELDGPAPPADEATAARIIRRTEPKRLAPRSGSRKA